MGNNVSVNESLYRRSFGPPDKRFLDSAGFATSRAFKPRPIDEGKLSVNVKSMTTEMLSVLNDPNKFVLFEVDVADVCALSLSVEHDPIESNEAHALILTIPEDDDILPGQLARKSRRVYF